MSGGQPAAAECLTRACCSAVLFPLVVTVYITWWFLTFFDNFFSVSHPGSVCDVRCSTAPASCTDPHAPAWQPVYQSLFGFEVFGLGFLTSMVFVFITGAGRCRLQTAVAAVVRCVGSLPRMHCILSGLCCLSFAKQKTAQLMGHSPMRFACLCRFAIDSTAASR